jgi:hypothetical protein
MVASLPCIIIKPTHNHQNLSATTLLLMVRTVAQLETMWAGSPGPRIGTCAYVAQNGTCDLLARSSVLCFYA